MGCWHELPRDLLVSIAERLPSIRDSVRLGAVCKPWSASLACFRPAHFPWLMLWTRRSDKAAFFCSQSYEIYRFPKPTPIRGRSQIVGCRDGWLVVVDESLAACIFNPVTGDRADLPSFSTLLELDGPSTERSTGRHVVTRVALSSTPSLAGTTDIFAAASYYMEGVQSIVFVKVGDDKWRSSIRLPTHIRDIIYYRYAFFVLYSGCQYQIFDPHGPEPKLTSSTQHLTTVFGPEFDCYNLALLPPSGELMVIGRETDGFLLKRFVVLVFDPRAGSPSDRWTGIKDLGGRSLFICDSLTNVGSGGVGGIRKNCIYCFDLHERIWIHVFDMEKGVFEPTSIKRPWIRRWDEPEPMFWFAPSLSLTSN